MPPPHTDQLLPRYSRVSRARLSVKSKVPASSKLVRQVMSDPSGLVTRDRRSVTIEELDDPSR